MPNGPAPLAYSISEACEVSSIGKTRLYQLINSGELRIRRVGRRTLVSADSLRDLITPVD